MRVKHHTPVIPKRSEESPRFLNYDRDGFCVMNCDAVGEKAGRMYAQDGQVTRIIADHKNRSSKHLCRYLHDRILHCVA